MKKTLENVKTITVNVNDLHTVVTAIKRKQNRITLITDYNTNTIYVTDKDITYNLKGFQ